MHPFSLWPALSLSCELSFPLRHLILLPTLFPFSYVYRMPCSSSVKPDYVLIDSNLLLRWTFDFIPPSLWLFAFLSLVAEDLSASIRKMGGSIHHYILQLQEDGVPNSELSERADLVRQRSAEILRATLQGLDYMHKHNLVHRDIKGVKEDLRWCVCEREMWIETPCS